MDTQQEMHLAWLKDQIGKELDIKYRVGAEEHKGHLWERKDLLEQAILEVIDLLAYLFTLRGNNVGNISQLLSLFPAGCGKMPSGLWKNANGNGC
jgi:hypothetical protein